MNASYTPRRSWRSVARGVASVVAVLAGALVALAAAAIGIPPVAWIVRQLTATARQAYRLGRFGEPSTCTDLDVVVVDAEIVSEEEHR